VENNLTDFLHAQRVTHRVSLIFNDNDDYNFSLLSEIEIGPDTMQRRRIEFLNRCVLPKCTMKNQQLLPT